MTVANGSPFYLLLAGKWTRLTGVAPGVDVPSDRPGSSTTSLGGGTSTRDADGSIHTPYGRIMAFANGTENHVAQIGDGQVTRMWNEPETKGEAYIPLAPEKRARSLDIWAETGRRLGVATFANGGTTGSGSSMAVAIEIDYPQLAQAMAQAQFNLTTPPVYIGNRTAANLVTVGNAVNKRYQ